jgi:hypothetical protein
MALMSRYDKTAGNDLTFIHIAATLAMLGVTVNIA